MESACFAHAPACLTTLPLHPKVLHDGDHGALAPVEAKMVHLLPFPWAHDNHFPDHRPGAASDERHLPGYLVGRAQERHHSCTSLRRSRASSTRSRGLEAVTPMSLESHPSPPGVTPRWEATQGLGPLFVFLTFARIPSHFRGANSSTPFHVSKGCAGQIAVTD